MRRFVAVVVACSFTVAGGIVAGQTPAGSEPCGLVVTHSMTLTGNVANCLGVTPITVQGSNLVLDLGGFTVSCRPGVTGEGPGIFVSFRNNVTIQNGTVRDCDTGIYLEGGGGHWLTRLTVIDNIGPLTGAGIFGEGIQTYGSHDNRITDNQVIHNGTFAGIVLYDSNRNQVTGNTVDRNDVIQENATHGGPRIMQDIGIWIVWLGDFPEPIARDNLIADNTVTRNGLDGVQLASRSTNNTVRNNQISQNGFGQVPGIRNGDGVAVFGQSSIIHANQVTGNAGNGIFVRNNRLNHRISGNRSVFNAQKPGPSAQFDMQDANVNCDANQWVSNQFGTRNQACIN